MITVNVYQDPGHAAAIAFIADNLVGTTHLVEKTALRLKDPVLTQVCANYARALSDVRARFGTIASSARTADKADAGSLLCLRNIVKQVLRRLREHKIDSDDELAALPGLVHQDMLIIEQVVESADDDPRTAGKDLLIRFWDTDVVRQRMVQKLEVL